MAIFSIDSVPSEVALSYVVVEHHMEKLPRILPHQLVSAMAHDMVATVKAGVEFSRLTGIRSFLARTLITPGDGPKNLMRHRPMTLLPVGHDVDGRRHLNAFTPVVFRHVDAGVGKVAVTRLVVARESNAGTSPVVELDPDYSVGIYDAHPTSPMSTSNLDADKGERGLYRLVSCGDQRELAVPNRELSYREISDFGLVFSGLRVCYSKGFWPLEPGFAPDPQKDAR